MNIKEFCRNHKKELLVTGLVVGGAVVGAIITKKVITKQTVKYATDHVLQWNNPGGFMNLEKVKEVLDANAKNAEPFAIFREGPNPDEFVCIMLSDNLVQV